MIDRTSNQRQIPVSKAAAHINGNTRVRPVSSWHYARGTQHYVG